MVLAHGGNLYVDEGRPVPGLVEKTLANLREVKPNFYFNVPRGFDMLLPFLEQDPSAARDVFERLEGLFYAGAALPQSLWERLEKVAATMRPRAVTALAPHVEALYSTPAGASVLVLRS